MLGLLVQGRHTNGVMADVSMAPQKPPFCKSASLVIARPGLDTLEMKKTSKLDTSPKVPVQPATTQHKLQTPTCFYRVQPALFKTLSFHPRPFIGVEFYLLPTTSPRLMPKRWGVVFRIWVAWQSGDLC